METEESIKQLISREGYPLKTSLLFLASLTNSSTNTCCKQVLLRAYFKLDNSKHTQKSWKANWQIWVRNHCLVTNNLSAVLKLLHFTPVWTQAFWSSEREGKPKQHPQDRSIPEAPVAQHVESLYPSLKSLVHWKHTRYLKPNPSDVSFKQFRDCSQVVPIHLFLLELSLYR